MTSRSNRRMRAQDRAEDVPVAQGIGSQPLNRCAGTSNTQFDSGYLDALSREGIDLRAFLHGWRQSIRDDLLQMQRLRDSRDVDGLRATLHRLSGAVGLVGAHTLMDALRCASVAHPEPEASALDAVAGCLDALMTELDAAVDPQRSDVP
jgi:HPt (histidine-containing phosphotransfer) domain-containing protein